MNEAVMLGALLILVGMQLAVGCLFAAFYLRQGAGTRALQARQETALRTLDQRVAELDQRTEALAESVDRPRKTGASLRDSDDGVRLELSRPPLETADEPAPEAQPKPRGARQRPSAEPALLIDRTADWGLRTARRQQSTLAPQSSVPSPEGAMKQEPERPMDRILQLAQGGSSSADIARATGRGRGEIELLLQLYRMESGSSSNGDLISRTRSKAWA